MNKLYGKRSKCIFGAQDIEHLRFMFKAGKIAMSLSKTVGIKAWTAPKSRGDVQSFLGLINYYQRLIKDCSKIAKPVTELTKDIPFEWTYEAEFTFRGLERDVISALVFY